MPPAVAKLPATRLAKLRDIVARVPASERGLALDFALAPSLNAVTFILRELEFPTVETLAFAPDEHEQFVRGQRVIVYGRRRN